MNTDYVCNILYIYPVIKSTTLIFLICIFLFRIVECNFISNRVACVRNAKGISARKLSLVLGMSSEYINQLENGRLMPSFEFIMDFCDYFEISMSEFFDEQNLRPVENKNLIKKLDKLSLDEKSY